MTPPFQIFDVVKSYSKREPLICVSATVIRQTETLQLLSITANTYGGFRNRTRVPRGAYATSELEAWQQFAAWERECAQNFRREAQVKDGYAEMAEERIAALTGASEAVA